MCEQGDDCDDDHNADLDNETGFRRSDMVPLIPSLQPRQPSAQGSQHSTPSRDLWNPEKAHDSLQNTPTRRTITAVLRNTPSKLKRRRQPKDDELEVEAPPVKRLQLPGLNGLDVNVEFSKGQRCPIPGCTAVGKKSEPLTFHTKAKLQEHLSDSQGHNRPDMVVVPKKRGAGTS